MSILAYLKYMYYTQGHYSKRRYMYRPIIGASLSEPHLVVSTAALSIIGASLSEPHMVIATAALSICMYISIL